MASNPWLGALAGALGGIAGSWAMVRFNHMVGGSDEDGGSHGHRRRHASPNDTDGTISDEPASSQTASRASEALRGRPLDERERQQAGPWFHYAFGALAGALYGAVAERQPAAAAGAGVPFGAAVWLAADEIGLPAAGLARNPATYPLSRHAAALGTHIVFGLTVEGVRRLLRA
jgi:putative membrane protein